MGSKTNYLEAKIMDHILGGPDYARPATVYLRLYTANPTDSAAGTEVTTGAWTNYVVKSITNNATNFPASVNGLKTLHIAQSYGTAVIPGTAPVITGIAICDAASAGNQLFWAALTTPRTINNGEVVSIAADAISLQED